MKGLRDKISEDFSPMSASFGKLASQLPVLAPKSRRGKSTGGSKSQKTASTTTSHLSTVSSNAALLQRKGYRLLPQGHRQTPQTVAKAKASDGRVVALKILNCASDELEILRGLQTLQWDRNHTVKLLGCVASEHKVGDVIIVMPWELPLEAFLDGCPNLAESLCTQFLEGVSFLHEQGVAHLDLKPGNTLVGYPGQSPLPRLSIIDFGLSVRVENEWTLVTGYRGTSSWTAPEVGTECGPPLTYSAILADRWSCGRVLWYITQLCPVGGAQTSEPGHPRALLLSSDPRRRPPLSKVLEVLWAQGSWTRGTAKRSADPDGTHVAQKRAWTRIVTMRFVCVYPRHAPMLRFHIQGRGVNTSGSRQRHSAPSFSLW